MSREIAEFSMADYGEAIDLWRVTEGISVKQADSPAGIERFLLRNPGLSFVARDEGLLIGTLLGGHDGRRGYIHHLAVAVSRRRQGIGKLLVERCLAGLRSIGLDACHIFVRGNNETGKEFWRRSGWVERSDLAMMTFYL